MKMLLIALAIVAAGLAYFSAHRPHGLSPAAGGLPPREVISTGEAAIGGAFTLSVS